MVMMIACGMVMNRGSTVCCGSAVDAGTDRHHSRLTSTKAASYTSHTVAAGSLSVYITRMMMCCLMGSIIILVEQRTGEAHHTAHHTAHTARSYCSSSRDSITGSFIIIPPIPIPILITPPSGSCGILSPNLGCPDVPPG